MYYSTKNRASGQTRMVVFGTQLIYYFPKQVFRWHIPAALFSPHILVRITVSSHAFYEEYYLGSRTIYFRYFYP